MAKYIYTCAKLILKNKTNVCNRITEKKISRSLSSRYHSPRPTNYHRPNLFVYKIFIRPKFNLYHHSVTFSTFCCKFLELFFLASCISVLLFWCLQPKKKLFAAVGTVNLVCMSSSILCAFFFLFFQPSFDLFFHTLCLTLVHKKFECTVAHEPHTKRKKNVQGKEKLQNFG